MLVHHLKGGQVESLAFGPDGRMLVVPRRDRGVFVWDDVTAGAPPRALRDTAGRRRFSNPHGRVRVSADGRRVGCHDWFRSCVYDTAGGAPVAVEPGDVNSEFHAALTPDGEAVVLSESRPRPDDVVGRFEARLSLRPVAPRPAADRWAIDIERWVWDEGAFLPGGEFVSPEVTYPVHRPRLDHRWVVRDLATGRELRSSPDLGRAAALATAAPDGRWVAGVARTSLVAWRADDPGAPPVERKNDGRHHFTGLAFHPSGAFLATTATDTTVRVYDTATWAVVRTYAWRVGKLRCVTFSPDGLLAAAGSDSGNIVVWDVDL